MDGFWDAVDRECVSLVPLIQHANMCTHDTITAEIMQRLLPKLGAAAACKAQPLQQQQPVNLNCSAVLASDYGNTELYT